MSAMASDCTPLASLQHPFGLGQPITVNRVKLPELPAWLTKLTEAVPSAAIEELIQYPPLPYDGYDANETLQIPDSSDAGADADDDTGSVDAPSVIGATWFSIHRWTDQNESQHALDLASVRATLIVHTEYLWSDEESVRLAAIRYLQEDLHITPESSAWDRLCRSSYNKEMTKIELDETARSLDARGMLSWKWAQFDSARHVDDASKAALLHQLYISLTQVDDRGARSGGMQAE